MKNINLLRLSFVVVLIATLGSLYYGYFGDPLLALSDGSFWDKSKALPPCDMCWYARIMMYPLLVTSFVGIVSQELRSISLIQITLSGLGSLLMLYLYGMQKRGWTSVTCDRRATVSCYDISVDYFGFITIPMLAFIAFLILLILGIILYKGTKKLS